MPSLSIYTRPTVLPAAVQASFLAPTPARLEPAPVRARRSTPDPEPVIQGPAWSLPASSSGNGDTAEGDAVLSAGLALALSSGHASVAVPENSSLAGALALFSQLVNQPETQEWFARKGLATDSITLHKHGIDGFVTLDGVRTAVSFSTTDDSGWWQASVKLRAIRDVLDPHDQGLPYVNGANPRVPLHVVLNAYGLDLAESAGQVVPRDGLTLSPQLPAALDDVKRVISDLDERAYLANWLEQQVQRLADSTAVDWSKQPTRLSPASAEGIGAQTGYDVGQLLAYKGLGTPRTAAATRNVIHWLRTALPPAPAMGNYVGLSAREPGGRAYEPLDTLASQNPTSLRIDTDAHLLRLLKGPDALAFGAQVVAALEGPAGPLAGYDLYQPANAGRTLSAVRSDLEQHFRESTGLDPSVAVLVAQIALARAAPEFLVREVPDAVAIGTPAWMELRLGVAMAEAVAPGTSRAMDEAQLSALTTLAPTSDEQRTLMQVRGLGVLLDWAVLNGVIPAKPEGQYTQEHIKKASQVFGRQRTLATRAFTAASTPVPMRRSLAVQELLKVFPSISAVQLETITVTLADANERRNLRPSEPRTRSLIETYMTGDLVPGKWILSSDQPQSDSSPSRGTPFQIQNTSLPPSQPRQSLDALIRRLPSLEGLLEKAVGSHHRKQQMGFVTKLKLMFAGLPLADRQRIELGAVDLFTLRKKTGKQQVWESDADRAAVTGRQGTLMRVLHDQSVTYYEVLNCGNIIKHDDKQVTAALDKVVRDRRYVGQYKLLGEKYIRGGHDVPLDFNAYARGAAPRAGVTSADVIIDRLGRSLEAGSLPANETLASFVPDSYQSDRVEFLACEIAENNFYESQADMLKRAKGQLPLEQRREASEREVNLLRSLVPFVGAYQDFADGNFGKGLQGLALDLVGVAIGAGGQARALVRSAKTLAQGSLRPSLGRLGATVAPMKPKPAWPWTEPKVRFSDAAFDVGKQTALFFSAVFNPADGYPRLINAASRGLATLPTLLASPSSGLGKAMPHLITVEEKMKCYLLVASGLVDPTKSPAQ